MIGKLEKLVDLAVVVLEMYAVKLKNEMEKKGELGINPPGAPEPEAPAKRTRKPRAPKAETTAAEPSASPAPADPFDVGGAESAPAAEPKKELTEEESALKVPEVTLAYIKLTKDDKPEDGKTKAMKMLQTDPRFKVGSLKHLTHPQRLLWVAEMEKGIAAAERK